MPWLISEPERPKRNQHNIPEKGESGPSKGRRYRPPGAPVEGGGAGFDDLFFTGTGIYAEYVTDTALSIPNDTLTVVQFDTKGADSHNAVTTGAGWRYTAPASGFYRGDASVMLSASSGWVNGEVVYLVMRKNGISYRTLYRTAFMAGGGASLYTPQVGAAFGLGLTTGEYIDFQVYQNSGGDLTLHNSTLYNYFTIWCVA